MWRNDATSELVYDDTVMVTSYVPDGALTDDAVDALRAFLHRMGRRARQGEVGVVIDNEYYGITEYDAEEGA